MNSSPLPFALVGRCLKQFVQQQFPNLVILTPVWETQPNSHCRPSNQTRGKPPPNASPVSGVDFLNQSYKETGISAQARTPLSAVLDFLTREFQYGKAYRSVNVYRSAISMTHPPWGVQQVIDFLEGLGENSKLCLKQLSIKLVIYWPSQERV